MYNRKQSISGNNSPTSLLTYIVISDQRIAVNVFSDVPDEWGSSVNDVEDCMLQDIRARL